MRHPITLALPSAPTRLRPGLAVVAALLLATLGGVSPAAAEAPLLQRVAPAGPLTCEGDLASTCADVLPGATAFAPVDGVPALVGTNAAGETVGWIARSTDLVDIKAYSGKPLVTLVGLDGGGVIVGARVIHHSEPILLVGIPEQALHDFVAFYVGKPATTKVTVGTSPDPEAIAVDAISGATVTVLAQNQTLLDTARALGEAVGVISAEALRPGHFVEGERPWSWAEMMASGALGRLTVTERDMGVGDSDAPFVDLFFTLADAPPLGRGLLGDNEYAHQVAALAPGEHLLVVLSNGSNTFKGSGFVRGGIFDRIRMEQGLRSLMFRDRDYTNLSGASAPDAPEFKEGAVFVARGGKLDPGSPFDIIFTGSRYDGQGGFHRDFVAFKGTFTLPSSVYIVDDDGRAPGIVEQAWYSQRERVALVALLLLVVLGLFSARRFLTGSMRRLQRIHIAVLGTSFLVLGVWLKAQPSVTQVLTLVGFARVEVDGDLFLSEPVLFVFWIVIALVTVTWGRGVFCGWTCPYGSLTELLNKLGQALHIPQFELPESLHSKARFIRYGVLALLVGTYLFSPQLAERMAEIEPFKTTFFVAPWTRSGLLIAWWVLITGISLVWWRPFCRYLCPLGAALAIPGSVRFAGPHRREFCSKCTICAKGCEPKAIRKDGSIDPRECLQCMECEATYRDEETCPPLVAMSRLRIAGAGKGVEVDPARLERAQRDARSVKGWRRPGRRA